MAKVDRILVWAQWELTYLMTTARAVKRPTSDHIPLCLSTTMEVQKRKKTFCFEKMCLRNEEVTNIIKDSSQIEA